MKDHFYKICMLLLFSACFNLSPLQAVEPLPEIGAAFQERMEWFTEAKFDLFIHYGVYSILDREWKGEPNL